MYLLYLGVGEANNFCINNIHCTVSVIHNTNIIIRLVVKIILICTIAAGI